MTSKDLHILALRAYRMHLRGPVRGGDAGKRQMQREKERERQETLCCQHDIILIMMMIFPATDQLPRCSNKIIKLDVLT